MDRLRCRKFRFWCLFAGIDRLGAVILISNTADLGLKRGGACAGSNGWPFRELKSNHVKVPKDD